MSYKPPFARMNQIRANATPRNPEVPPQQPASVDEALAEMAVEEPEAAEPETLMEAVAELGAAEPEPEPVEPEPVEEEDEPVEEEDEPVEPEPEDVDFVPPVEDEEAPVEPEPEEPETVPAVEDEPEPVEASLDNTRAELNAIAESLGIEKPQYMPNKQAVLDAINDALVAG